MGALPVVLDSWWEPTSQQIANAAAAGVVAWAGYFSQHPGSDAIYHGWADSTFAAILDAGMATFAYCSGWDDPGYVADRAAALGICAILDCETSIKPEPYNGSYWVDGWLSAAPGVGLYSNQGSGVLQNHIPHNHPCYVNAAYNVSGSYWDPAEYWPSGLAVPATPYGWQYADVAPDGSNADSSHFVPELLALGRPKVAPSSSAGHVSLSPVAGIRVPTPAAR